MFITVYVYKQTLEQHGFELHGSTLDPWTRAAGRCSRHAAKLPPSSAVLLGSSAYNRPFNNCLSLALAHLCPSPSPSTHPAAAIYQQLDRGSLVLSRTSTCLAWSSLPPMSATRSVQMQLRTSTVCLQNLFHTVRPRLDSAPECPDLHGWFLFTP